MLEESFYNQSMEELKMTFKKIALTISIVVLGLIVFAPTATADEVHAIEESEYLIISGGIYNLSAPFLVEAASSIDFAPFHYNGNSTTTAPTGATVTTGNGRFWTAWPRADQLVSFHSNPTYRHRSSACNMNTCIRSHGQNGWRSASSTGSARSFVTASGHGNSAHWAVQTPCSPNWPHDGSVC